MHRDNFVLAIKDPSGNILRETSGNVYLPFHSEYSLVLKNNNNRRAVVSVKIDGTNVLGERRLVLNAWSSLDLERFLSDGNLSSGRKLKFVSVTDSRVQDPSSSQNGLVEVTFQLEALPYITYPLFTTPWPNLQEPYFRYPWDNSRTYKNSHNTPIQNSCVGSSSGGSSSSSTTACYASFSMQQPAPQAGATVEGGVSNQEFGTTSVGMLEAYSTTLSLRIMAPPSQTVTATIAGTVTLPGVLKVATTSYTVKNTRKKYCVSCGKKLRFQDRFCSKCGIQQPEL